MTDFTLKDEVKDDLNGWQDTLARILAVPSYKKFFDVTSQHSPVIVPNNPKFAQSSDRHKCHLNCKNSEINGIGKQISGWYIVCDLIYKEFPVGLCRLIHHSNLLLADGSFVNPTNDENRTHHLFIRDDKRHFDFSNNVGYNDRMIFGDEFMKGNQATKAIPRNKIHFASNQYFDRNLVFEKFKVYDTKQEATSITPRDLSKEEYFKWITLKTNVTFD